MLECAIITARGGSRGLPGKNVKVLGGAPLIAWTIQAATVSASFDRVVVSTDDKEIARVARQYGAEVPFLRPAELATSTASSRDVLLHALDELTIEGRFALLQPTSPFRNAGHIREAVRQFSAYERGSLISVVASKPLQWNLTSAEDGRLRDAMSGPIVTRRQDAGKIVQPNGAMYFYSSDEYRRESSPTDATRFGYEMGVIDSIDIDTKEDFALAEAVVKAGLRTID